MSCNDTYICFRHENETFFVKETQFPSDRFSEEFKDQNNIEFQYQGDHKHVQMFFQYLLTGTIPENKSDIDIVRQFLVGWRFNDLIIKNFDGSVICKIKNGLIQHKDQTYPINVLRFTQKSHIYKDFVLYQKDSSIFEIDQKFSSETVVLILKLIHKEIESPDKFNARELLELCQYLECDPLSIIHENSFESIILSIIQNQTDEDFDFSLYEKILVGKLDMLLSNPNFAKISIPLLCRIFQKIHRIFCISYMENFLEKCYEFHGPSTFYLLSVISFEPLKNIIEINRVNSIFSGNIHSFFDHSKNLLDEYINEHEKLKTKCQQLESHINKIKTQHEKERNSQLKMLESERNRSSGLEQRISILEKQIEENTIFKYSSQGDLNGVIRSNHNGNSIRARDLRIIFIMIKELLFIWLHLMDNTQ